MDRGGLEKKNVGENLDALMNLDPRGYGGGPDSLCREPGADGNGIGFVYYVHE